MFLCLVRPYTLGTEGAYVNRDRARRGMWGFCPTPKKVYLAVRALGLAGLAPVSKNHRILLVDSEKPTFVGCVPIFPIRLPAKPGVKEPYVSTCRTDPLCSA